MTGQQWVGFAAMLCGGASAFAQSIVVQQPVVDLFSVSTVVTVPDRGSAFLGGISAARDQRVRWGFGPPGSSLGMERSHSGAWASVFIHDLEGMDAALLAAGRPAPSPRPNALAAQAYRTLWQQHTGRPPPASALSAMAPNAGGAPPIVAPLPADFLPPAGRSDAPPVVETGPDVTPSPARSGPPAVGAFAAPSAGVRRWSARLEGSSGTTPAAARERFGAPAPSHSTSASSGDSAAANRATNSGDSPAANRASR